jgi:hypothetical protein
MLMPSTGLKASRLNEPTSSLSNITPALISAIVDFLTL